MPVLALSTMPVTLTMKAAVTSQHTLDWALQEHDALGDSEASGWG